MYVVVHYYYQYTYVQIDIADGIIFNLSDKRKSKEGLLRDQSQELSC